MASHRLVVLYAAISASLIAAPAGKTGIWAEYAGGTVTMIPLNTLGTLNFDDTQQLRFRYDKSSGAEYQLPYARITGTEVARMPDHKVLHRISVPKFMTGGKRETLSITFRDDTGVPQMLTFTLTPDRASLAQSMLAMRVAKPDPAQAVTAKGAAPPATETSWSDKLWKTARNQASWPTAEQEKPQQQQQPQQPQQQQQ